MATAGPRARTRPAGGCGLLVLGSLGLPCWALPSQARSELVSVAACVTVDGAECLPPRAAAGRT